jgi:hypothetical protein
MPVPVTIELPDDLAATARAVAGTRTLPDAVLEWVRRSIADPPVESLPDDQVLMLSRSELPPADQDALANLLAEQAEGTISATGRIELDRRMSEYRRAWVLQARALKEAVRRGLCPPLGDGQS